MGVWQGWRRRDRALSRTESLLADEAGGRAHVGNRSDRGAILGNHDGASARGRRQPCGSRVDYIGGGARDSSGVLNVKGRRVRVSDAGSTARIREEACVRTM